MTLTRRATMLGLLATTFAPSMVRAGVQVEGGLAFGSSWRVTLDDTTSFARLRPLIETVIAEVDDQMSPFRATSALSAFNATEVLGWQPMPRPLTYVATEALRMAALTNGAFDPTVGPIVSRFGFGPITGKLGPVTGIAASATALRKAAPDLTLDLCGIAKGYALDRIIAALRSDGVANALVEVGGEVRTLGTHPDGRDWSVAVADPNASGFAAHRIVAPGTMALATSGHAANGVTGQITTSHIIDPRHGRPASDRLASVSVLAQTAMRADALATALCALGPEAGVKLARNLGVAALFVGKGPHPTEVMTGQFRKFVLA